MGQAEQLAPTVTFTGCRAGSLALYFAVSLSANAMLLSCTAQPEKLPTVQFEYMAVPKTLCAQKVPAGQGVTVASVVPVPGQYVPLGQPVQLIAKALL